MVSEASVLNDLANDLSYENVAERNNTSRGTVYRIAVKHGARKHEQRIQERAAQSKARRQAFLEEVINTTTKADVLDFWIACRQAVSTCLLPVRPTQ